MKNRLLQNFNKLVAMILILIITLSFIPNLSFAGETATVDGVTATLLDDGTLTIFGSGEITSRLTHGTGILFTNTTYDFSSLTKRVIIGKGITRIGTEAFYMFDNLTSIEIPEGVTSIGNRALCGCTNLTNVIIPKGVTSIGTNAFGGCANLTNIEIPEGLTNIGSEAFSNCENLTSVIVSKGVTSIEDGAFSGCVKLTNIEIPEGVTSIGANAFSGCESLTNIIIPKGVTSIGSGAFDKSGLISIEIPGSVTSIEYGAFMNCENLTSAIIQEGVTSIGDFAFASCDNLTSVKIPKGLTNIGKSAFFFSGLTSIELPEGVINIGDLAFAGCNLKSVKILERNAIIGDSAFGLCGSLTSVEMPEGVASIGGCAFQRCGLTSIEIPEGVTDIGESAFWQCNNLRSVKILEKNVKLGTAVFEDCHDLTIYGYKNSTAQKYYEENKEDFEQSNIKFEIIDEPETITKNGITYLLYTQHKTASVIKVDANAISSDGKLFIPDSVNSNDNVTYTVTKINSNSVEIENIQSIRLPEELTTIEENAFTKYIGTIEIPKNVSSLHINAFSTREVDIIINENNPYYFISGVCLYSGSKNERILHGVIKNVEESNPVMSSSIVEIKEKAFKYFTNLETVTLGVRTTKIADDAFEGLEDKITIKGYTESYAEKYAKEHNINFISLGEMPYFIWTEDNYSFVNGRDDFSSYEIGEYKKYLPNTLKEYAKLSEKSEWGGSCFGMAITSILFKTGLLDINKWQIESPKNDYTYDLTSPHINEKLRWLINFYQVFQNGIKRNYANKLYGGNDLEEFYNSVKEFYEDNNKRLLLCGYHWEDSGHEVIITGKPEELDFDFYKERGWNFDANNYYGHRIPIYNVNDCINEQYLYIKEDFSKISLGYDKSLIDSFDTTADNSSNGTFESIDIYDVENVVSLEDLIKNNETLEFSKGVYVMYKIDKVMKFSNDSGEYADIEGLDKTNGTLKCDIQPILGTIADEETKGNIKEAEVVLEDDDWYKVETKNDHDELDVSILYGDSFMLAKTKEGGKATFENKKSVELSNPSGQEYETKITLNEEYAKLPWYTITASGTGTKEIKTEMTDDGVVVTGDNLNNLTITGNNEEEETQLNVDTDQNKVLIKANDTKTNLVAYVDKDSNGTYETQISEGTSQDKEETQKPNSGTDNNSEETENSQDKEETQKPNSGIDNNSEGTGNSQNKEEAQKPNSGIENNLEEVDTSITDKELPYTGLSIGIGVAIIISIGISIFTFIKYLKYKNA